MSMTRDIIGKQQLDPFILDVRDTLLKSKSPGVSCGYKAKVLQVAKMEFFEEGLIWVKLIKRGGLEHPVLLCPSSMRHLVIAATHSSPLVGHSGHLVSGGHDVQNFLHKCAVCQEMQGRKPIPSPLNSLPTGGEPNLRVHMDHFVKFGRLMVRSIL